ncbi:hypothetical protein ACHAQA_008660 [Verticillium albo-atrum]
MARHDRSPPRDTHRSTNTLAGPFALEGFIDGLPPWATRQNDEARARAVLAQRKYVDDNAPLEERIYVNVVVLFRALLHFSALKHDGFFYGAVCQACGFAATNASMIQDLTKVYSSRRRIWLRNYGRETRPTLVASLTDEWCRRWADAVRQRGPDDAAQRAIFDAKMRDWHEFLTGNVRRLLDPEYWPYSHPDPSPRIDRLQRDSDSSMDQSSRKRVNTHDERDMPDEVDNRADKRHCIEPRDPPGVLSPSESRLTDEDTKDLMFDRTERPQQNRDSRSMPERPDANAPGERRTATPSNVLQEPGATDRNLPYRDEILETNQHLAASQDVVAGTIKNHESRLQKLETPGPRIGEICVNDAELIDGLVTRAKIAQKQANDHDARITKLEERSTSTGPSQAQVDDLAAMVAELARRLSESEALAKAQAKRIEDSETAARAQDERIEAQARRISQGEVASQRQLELNDKQTQRISKGETISQRQEEFMLVQAQRISQVEVAARQQDELVKAQTHRITLGEISSRQQDNLIKIQAKQISQTESASRGQDELIKAHTQSISRGESASRAQDERIIAQAKQIRAQTDLIAAQEMAIVELGQYAGSSKRLDEMQRDFVAMRGQIKDLTIAMSNHTLSHTLQERLQHSLEYARAVHATEFFKTKAQMLASADLVVQLEKAVQSLARMEQV